MALISGLSKAFETILNRKFLKHLNLLSHHQYGFRKGRSTGDLLAFLTDSSSSSLSRFGKTYRKLSIESGRKLCFLNYSLTTSILLSVLFFLVSFQAILLLL